MLDLHSRRERACELTAAFVVHTSSLIKLTSSLLSLLCCIVPIWNWGYSCTNIIIPSLSVCRKIAVQAGWVSTIILQTLYLETLLEGCKVVHVNKFDTWIVLRMRSVDVLVIASFPGSPGMQICMYNFNVRIPERGSLGTRLYVNLIARGFTWL